jgi:hypothetical protein
MNQLDNINDNNIYINNFNNINNIILCDDYIINNYIETDTHNISWIIDRTPNFTILNELQNIHPNYDAFNINMTEQIDTEPDDFIPFETEISIIYPEIDIVVEEFDISEEDKICCICIETRENSQICRLNCFHKFCYECTLIHTRRNNIQSCCPLCRTNIRYISVQSQEIRDQFT